MSAVKKHKIKLREVNRHLVCRLCRGYFVDATTIAECLHSFCRSCIIKYLEKNSFCPICEVQIHKTKPYLNLRLDKALQDVVYKLVPGLFHNEMKRRREFYAKHPQEIPVATPEQCGLEERLIFSPEDSISLSLEYLDSQDCEIESVSSRSSESGDNPDGLSFPQQLGLMKLKKSDGRNSRRESQDVQEPPSHPKRYLQCPAVVNMSHLKKFIRMKYDLSEKMQVDIMYKRVPIPNHYTLMDVAYIYTWKRSAPMRFFYQILELKTQKVKIPTLEIQRDETKPKQSKDVVKPKPVEKPKEPVDKTNVDLGQATVPMKLREEINKTDVSHNNTKPEASKKQPEENKKTVPSKEVKPCAKKNASAKVSDETAKVEKQHSDIAIKTDSEKAKPIVSDCEVKLKSEPDVKNSNNETSKPVSPEKAKEKQVTGGEKLLLNPYSGKLESVPLKSPEKPVDAWNVQRGKPSTEGAAEKQIPVKKESAEEESKPEVKKSSVQVLKTFRKEKPAVNRDGQQGQAINGTGNSLTITTITKRDKPAEKMHEANVSIEIKTEKRSCEYDFETSSPPSKIMSLQEFTKTVQYKSKFCKSPGPDSLSKENGVSKDEDPQKKDKAKNVPSLYRINSDGSKKTVPKTPNGKIEKNDEKRISPTIINIKTENEDSKPEIRIEVPNPKCEKLLPPRPIKIENRGELVVKQADSPKRSQESNDKNKSNEPKKQEEGKKKDSPTLRTLLKRTKDGIEIGENGSGKKQKTSEEETPKSEHFGAIDLSKTDTSPKSGKNPLENLMELAKKTGDSKNQENMLEMLISYAAKHSMEPLLRVPQYPQGLKGSPSQDSQPQGNITPTAISQALQFYQQLSSEMKMKVLQANTQLTPNSMPEHKFLPKPPNCMSVQQYYQEQMKALKRQQNSKDSPPQQKKTKLSPNSERNTSPKTDKQEKTSPGAETSPKYRNSPRGSPTKEEANQQLKSSVERTLSQIQEQAKIHTQLYAAQNFKHLPALLQFYNNPQALLRAGAGTAAPNKANQNKGKSSSQSPNSQKSPQNLTPPPVSLPMTMSNAEAHFFTTQNYFFNPGLTSEMTYHQMFQNYISQQNLLNQRKTSQKETKTSPPGKPSQLTSNLVNEFHYAAQNVPKKSTESTPTPAPQKT